MILADLRDGDRVFIDANILIYHFGGRSLECKAFLERCARHQEDVNKILQMNLTILHLTLDIVKGSAEVRKSEGLLTNDSFVVACMREQGLTKLATANGDFDQVGGIEVYKPTDLEGENTP